MATNMLIVRCRCCCCHCCQQVLRDLFLALGASEQQLLPLEVESLNCGGNARCSIELTRRLGLQPRKIIMVQVGVWYVCCRLGHGQCMTVHAAADIDNCLDGTSKQRSRIPQWPTSVHLFATGCLGHRFGRSVCQRLQQITIVQA